MNALRCKLAGCVTAIISITLMAWPIVSSAATSDGHGMGYIAPSIKLNKIESSSSDELLQSGSYPTKYDPRNEAWYKNNIAIKNQGSSGLCWAFASTSCAEISYAKEIYNLGLDYTSTEMSPGHLGYFAYNRAKTVTDPLGNAYGDQATNSYWYSVGGNSSIALTALANRNGLTSASKAPYSWVEEYSISSNPTYNYSLAYDDALVIEEAEYYEYKSIRDINLIKSMIDEHGAVSCGIQNPNPDYSDYCQENSDGTYSMYCWDSMASSCHEVAIIGWDDNYSYSNFKRRHPDGNGAWLIQNSWGDSVTYIWVSYYDTVIYDQLVAYDVKEADSGEILFQHDGTASVVYCEFGPGEQAANIFTVPNKNYCLQEVGLIDWNDGTCEYNIAIYTELPDNSNPIPEDAEPACTFDVTTTSAGYHTFDLPTAVVLGANTIYSIVITPKTTTYLGVDDDYDISSTEGWVKFRPSIFEGQSFMRNGTDYEWLDLATDDDPYTMRIKGIASNMTGIMGKVDGYTGQSLLIELIDSDGNKQTSSSAKYSFTDVIPGDYTIRVSAGGNFVTREYSVTATGEALEKNLEIRELGDANCDGKYTSEDTTRIARHLARLSVEKDDYTLKLFNADRSEDGKITAADATKLARYAAGIVEAL